MSDMRMENCVEIVIVYVGSHCWTRGGAGISFGVGTYALTTSQTYQAPIRVAGIFKGLKENQGTTGGMAVNDSVYGMAKCSIHPNDKIPNGRRRFKLKRGEKEDEFIEIKKFSLRGMK